MFYSFKACIDKKLAELILRSQTRRAEFKSVWGVSPRCINKKRTVKTVINAPKVAFSTEVCNSNDKDNNEIDEQLTSTEHMFGNITESEKANEDENVLEKSISHDLLELYIDANFDQPLPGTIDSFNDINSTTLNTPNIDEIIPSIQIDSFLENLTSTSININSKNNPMENTTIEKFDDKAIIETAEGLDNFDEIDMDMETLGEVNLLKEDWNHIPQASPDHIATNMGPAVKESDCTLDAQSNDYTAAENLEDRMCLRTKDISEKKSIKSVRFLNATPNENDALKVQPHRNYNQPASEQRISRPKNGNKRRSIQVQIPVHFRSG